MKYALDISSIHVPKRYILCNIVKKTENGNKQDVYLLIVYLRIQSHLFPN
jgi:hypothetical protein